MARLVLPKTLSLMCVVVSLLTCNGCVGIVVAAATMGSVVVLKGETLSAMERDHRITATLSRHWRKNKLPHSQLVIETYHGVVLLVGHVSTQAYTQPLVHFAHQVPGVRRVYHEIARAPALSVGRRSKDAWITTKVKSHFVAQKSISATAIKVSWITQQYIK